MPDPPASPDQAGGERVALIVLGMHRSGTSALAGVMGALGVTLPQDLMDAAPMNAKGFFESNRITALNDRILAQVGMTWWDPGRFPDAWLDGDQAVAMLDEAVHALRADYGDAPLFVIKDPRICRLLPFWRRALDRVGARPVIAHVHRAARDVAASLARWADYEDDFGLILWARHIVDGIGASGDLPRSFVRYEDLMTDWRAVTDRIAEDLAITWPCPADQAAGAVQDFLSRDLHHFQAGLQDDAATAPLPPAVRDLQDLLDGWAGGQGVGDTRIVDRLRDALDLAGPLYAASALGNVQRAREVRRLTERIAELQSLQRAEVDRIMAERREVGQHLAQARARLTRATQDGDQQLARNRELSTRIVSIEDRLHVALAQNRQFARQRQAELADRMRLALALDDPQALSASLTQLHDRVEDATAALRLTEARLVDQARDLTVERDTLRADLARMRDDMRAQSEQLSVERDQAAQARDDARRREADLLSSTSWRITAPLRRLSRMVRRRG